MRKKSTLRQTQQSNKTRGAEENEKEEEGKKTKERCELLNQQKKERWDNYTRPEKLTELSY
jgi:hypothetical protein